MPQNAEKSLQTAETPTRNDQGSTRLLISVKSAAEAAMVLQAEIDWIDLKAPDKGPLGAPSVQTAKQVAMSLGDFSNRSVALGELHQLHTSVAADLSSLFPVAKVGLSQLATQIHWVRDFVTLSADLAPSKLVPVLYADGQLCGAPSPEMTIALAAETAAPYLLIDTFEKNGRGLLDWMSLEEIADTIDAARAIGSETVLAGSLQTVDIPSLLELSPAALAFRGAACGGRRTDSLCDDLIKTLRKLVNSI